MTARTVTSPDDGFPRLQGDTVLVAAPSDLAGLRAQVERVVRRVAAEAGAASQLQPYSWDLQFDPDGEGFDQRFSMQQQIPRPADPACRGVVCLLSERIGSPLDDAFPLHLCPQARAWQDPQHKYRLQHPWPQDAAAQKALLDAGAFPLTGTIWEFLDAVAVGVPLFLGFIADRRVDAEDPGVKFGRGLLYESYATHGFQAHQAWVERTYAPQIRALRNFVGAVIAHGLDVRTYGNDVEMVAAVRAFLSTAVLKRGGDSARSPFKGLAHYDIEDGDVFHGRAQLADSIVRDFDELAQSDDGTRAIGLIGVSGTGKSSALRAAVLYRLQARAQRGRYHVMAVRPTDFQNERGEPENVVQKLVLQYVRSTGIGVPGQRLAEAFSVPARETARAAVNLIAETLPPALDGQRSRLVIGLDQLEEIVDDLLTPASARAWRPLLDFLAEARKGDAILFIYTLEASRRESIRRTPLAPFVDELRQYAVANGPEFWREIVTQPFRSAGIVLSERVRRALYERVDALTRNRTAEENGALLPLVALALSNIYGKAKQRTDELKRRAGPRRLGEAPQVFEIDLDAFDDTDFEIGRAIANEASAVVRDHWTLEGGKPAREDVDNLLRPFVRLTEGQEDAVTLRAAAVPRYEPERSIVTAFLGRRLAVRVDANTCRLVHEALLHHWEPAREWLDSAVGELGVEREMRAAAQKWDRAGRDARALEPTPERIETAVDLLATYARAWTGADVIEHDRVLRDFCLELLHCSSAPAAVVRSSSMQSTHAYVAAAYGRLETLRRFAQIDRAALLAARAGDRRAPIHAAAYSKPEAVEYLLRQGAQATAPDEQGFPPLEAAITGGSDACFRLLLPHYAKAQLDGDPDAWNALDQAVTQGRTAMARSLVDECGVDANVRGGWGTPLHKAAWFDRLDLAELLLPLTDPTLIDDWGRTPLHVAAERGSVELVEALLASYDPNAPVAAATRTGERGGWTALHYAAAARSAAAVRCLMDDARTDPNARGDDQRTALSVAGDDVGARTELLEDDRVDPWQPIDASGTTPLEMALRLGLWPLCQRMLKRPAPAGSLAVDGYRLFRAALANDAPRNVLSALVTRLRDRINQPNTEGRTPLIAAAERGRLDAIDLLVKEANADPTYACPGVGTALQVALARGSNVKVLEALWGGTRSELRNPDADGWTPLHSAAMRGNVEVGRWLLSKGGADLAEVRDAWNRTPADVGSTVWRRALGGAVDESPAPGDSWQRGMEWLPLDGDDRKKAQAAIDELDGQRRDNPLRRSGRTRYELSPVSFLPPDVVRVMRVSDPDWPIDLHSYYYAVRAPDGAGRVYHHLNGASAPLHDVNEVARIKLDAAAAPHYLRFFCFFCRGDEGPFVIVENARQREIPPLPEPLRAQVEELVRPARVWGWDEEHGAHRISAVVYYSTALFFADFLLKPDGQIEMVRDRPLMVDLPVPRGVDIG